MRRCVERLVALHASPLPDFIAPADAPLGLLKDSDRVVVAAGGRRAHIGPVHRVGDAPKSALFARNARTV
jgi:hypothetical protein